MPDRFRVTVTEPMFSGANNKMMNYFLNFWSHCNIIAEENDWAPITVANYQLRPLGGRLIQTRTQGWYLRWDNESAHTVFVLRWT